MATPLWSSQPFKAIFIVIFLLISLAHVAVLSVKYLIKPLRPLPARSWRHSLLAAVGKKSFQLFARTHLRYVLYDDPVLVKEKRAHVELPAAHFFSGLLAASDTVKPVALDAVWFPGPPIALPNTANIKNERVVLHFPGGAFVIALGPNQFGPLVADSMVKHLKATTTIWAQYRLSSGSPDTCFPAALQDALTFYTYILALGVEPKNVILSGDSAGGNVVLGLMRYLESLQTTSQPLSLPGGAMVFSPWVSVTANAGEHYDRSDNSRSDTLCGSLLQWGADSYRPQGEVSTQTEAYISPLHHPFKLSIPLFIHDGAAEAFHGDIKVFADEMIQMNGDRVHFRSTPLATHDVLFGHIAFGLTEQFDADLRQAAEFLCQRL